MDWQPFTGEEKKLKALRRVVSREGGAGSLSDFQPIEQRTDLQVAAQPVSIERLLAAHSDGEYALPTLTLTLTPTAVSMAKYRWRLIESDGVRCAAIGSGRLDRPDCSLGQPRWTLCRRMGARPPRFRDISPARDRPPLLRRAPSDAESPAKQCFSAGADRKSVTGASLCACGDLATAQLKPASSLVGRPAAGSCGRCSPLGQSVRRPSDTSYMVTAYLVEEQVSLSDTLSCLLGVRPKVAVWTPSSVAIH